MPTNETRQMVLTAAAVCEEKKGQDTRVLELDASDSGFTDFFVITSAANERQAVAIADEVELRLKRTFGAYPHSVEGRRVGEWILLDYVDFVVHVFLAERRAFYDIERLRKSARHVGLAELKRALAKKAPAKKKAPARKTAAKKAAPAKKAPAKKTAKATARKTPAKKAPAKKSTAKKGTAKATRKTTARKTTARKSATGKTSRRK